MKTPPEVWRLALILASLLTSLPLLAFTDADWVSLCSSGDGVIYAIAVDSRSNVYVGGSFGSIGGVPANNIAKWDGHAWSALPQYSGPPPGVGGGGVDGAVYALAVDNRNRVYVGGVFSNALYGGIPAHGIAKWSGTSWSALGTGLCGTYGNSVRALATIGTNLYAGGYFTDAGGVPVSPVAKWDGSAWSGVGEGPGGGFPGGYTIVGPWVNALAVNGTNLYAGGYFALPSYQIAKSAGSIWSAMHGLAWTNNVAAIAVSGTNVYAAGEILAGAIGKWNGSSWSALGSGVSGGAYVAALATNGTHLYVGGSFSGAGGVAARNLAKWDGTSWSGLGSGVNGTVYALAVDAAGHLLVGGSFTTAGTNFSPMIAQANIGPGFEPGRFDQFGYSPLTGFTCTFRDGTPGQPYRIQTRPSLNTGTWTNFTNFTFTAPLTFTNPASTTSTFYRAISP